MNVSFPVSEQKGLKNETRIEKTIFIRSKKHCLFPYTLLQAHKTQRESTRIRHEGIQMHRNIVCLCSEAYICYGSTSQIYKFSYEGLQNRTLEDSGDGHIAKYKQVLNESVNFKYEFSNNQMMHATKFF